MTDGTGQSPSFISSGRRTVHHGTREDGAECGTQYSGQWAVVDADSEEEAVMKYDIRPCSRCFDRHYTLNQWRLAEYSSTVMHGVTVPDRWSTDREQ